MRHCQKKRFSKFEQNGERPLPAGKIHSSNAMAGMFGTIRHESRISSWYSFMFNATCVSPCFLWMDLRPSFMIKMPLLAGLRPTTCMVRRSTRDVCPCLPAHSILRPYFIVLLFESWAVLDPSIAGLGHLGGTCMG